MIKDDILKCVLMELSAEIEKVETKVARHEIVRILDDTQRNMSKLAVSNKKPEPVKPLNYSSAPKIAKLYAQHEEILIVLHETNPDNVPMTIRELYELNTDYFDTYFKVTSPPYTALSSVVTTLVRKGYVERSYDITKHGSASLCNLTSKGLKQVNYLQQGKYFCASQEYRNVFGGGNYAHSY